MWFTRVCSVNSCAYINHAGTPKSQVGGMIVLALLDILKSEALAWKDTHSSADWTGAEGEIHTLGKLVLRHRTNRHGRLKEHHVHHWSLDRHLRCLVVFLKLQNAECS